LKFEAGTVGFRARNWDGPSLTIGSKTKTTLKMRNQNENRVLVLEKKKNN
jgi:hypothetical protein